MVSVTNNLLQGNGSNSPMQWTSPEILEEIFMFEIDVGCQRSMDHVTGDQEKGGGRRKNYKGGIKLENKLAEG